MGKNKQKYTYWNIPVTKTFNELVEKAVKETGYVSKSEFVRDSVRKMLVNLGFLGLKKKKKGVECPFLGDCGYCTLTGDKCEVIFSPNEDLPEKYWEWCPIYLEELEEGDKNE